MGTIIVRHNGRSRGMSRGTDTGTGTGTDSCRGSYTGSYRGSYRVPAEVDKQVGIWCNSIGSYKVQGPVGDSSSCSSGCIRYGGWRS